MIENKAEKNFAKYNPAEAVTRCPNGRAPVRKQLDVYARAAINLYGVIAVHDFSEIFNRHNTEQVNDQEVFSLLLPLVLKKKWYCFYKDYIVHYGLMEDFSYADAWIRAQGDKPRFIPEKDEFLAFENPYYESKTQALHWQRLQDFINKEWPENYQRFRCYNELKELSKFSADISKAINIIDQYGLVFNGEKQMQAFLDLVSNACNNTRLWSNKGYSPNELGKIMQSLRPKNASPEIVVQKRRKIGANESCPCGSGKKYKKCCRMIEKAQTAQLSASECTLFYETWYGLMGFINEQKKIINAKIMPKYPNPVSDEQMYNVRELLWKNPQLIDDYLDAVKLPEEKAELLRSWRKHHKIGMFILMAYTPECALVIGSNRHKEDRLYGITGISRSLTDAMQRRVPLQFQTVLLPFKDKIIYDSFLSITPVVFGEGMTQTFQEMYDEALAHGIITSLNANNK